eukprot:3621729-Rhodomonas_salina.1
MLLLPAPTLNTRAALTPHVPAHSRVALPRPPPSQGPGLTVPVVLGSQVADGGYKTGVTCPGAARDSAPLVLAQALWALHSSSSFLAGLDALLAGGGTRGAMA